jgi:glycosyltransferase involved in cell wall biosynthesis
LIVPHPPAVSVSICLYNSSRYIDETIESLLAQRWTDFEAILVDDGSTDGCLERAAARFPDSRLKLVRQPHRGLAAARLQSVSHARGRYIAFLDHDDLPAGRRQIGRGSATIASGARRSRRSSKSHRRAKPHA